MLVLAEVDGTNQYQIVDCEIRQKALNLAEADVTLHETIQVRSGQYFRLLDEGTPIFMGRVECARNSNSLNLCGIPTDFKEQINSLKQRYRSNFLYRLHRSELITWSCDTLKGRDLFDTEMVERIDRESIFHLDFKLRANYTTRYETRVRWDRRVHEMIDLGSNIFETGPIKTITPESLLSAWPTEGSDHYGCYVYSSSLQIDQKKLIRIDQDKVTEEYAFLGNLKLQRLCEQSFDESWIIKLNDTGSVEQETIKLYLNLGKYLEQYPRWAQGTFYLQGTKALVPNESGQEVRIANKDHMAGEYSLSDWDECESAYFYNNEDVLASSEVGKNVLEDLCRTISAHNLLHEPEVEFELLCIWDVWKRIQVYNLLCLSHNSVEYTLRVVEYKKVANYKRKYVKVKCHGYKRIMKMGESLLKVGEISIIEAGSELQGGLVNVSVCNLSENQIESYPNVQPTKIRYTLKQSRSRYKLKLDVKTEWNLI